MEHKKVELKLEEGMTVEQAISKLTKISKITAGTEIYICYMPTKEAKGEEAFLVIRKAGTDEGVAVQLTDVLNVIGIDIAPSVIDEPVKESNRMMIV